MISSIISKLKRLLGPPMLARRTRVLDRLPEQTQRDIEANNARGGL